MPYHTPGSGNPGMMGNRKNKRKPYPLKKMNKGENENTGIDSNPAGTGKEQENSNYLDSSKADFPKNKNFTGKSGTMTY